MIDKFSWETILTRLRPPITQTTNQELKSIPPEIDSKIASTQIKCEINAVTPTIVKAIEYSLRQLARHSKIYDLEDVKRHVAARAGQRETPVTVVET